MVNLDSNRNKLDSQQPSKSSPATSNMNKAGSSSSELYDAPSSTGTGLISARFLTPNGTLITAQRGSTASLPCEVVSLGDGVVSNDNVVVVV